MDPRDADRDALIDFLTSNVFPFHMTTRPSREQAAHAIDDGDWDGDEHRAYWVHLDGQRLGTVRLDDLEDPTPVLDLRLAEEHRGRGHGRAVLDAVTELVFRTMPGVNRFEGQTREDNIAMRRVFLRAGWIKEAHYREGWPVENGTPLASVAYAILRRDWETGEVTSFEWEDLTA